MKHYDVLILGAGPAGLTAAVYALRYNLQTAILGGVPGGLMMETHKICNWPGDQTVSGWELSTRMKDQATALGVNWLFSEAVTLTAEADGWSVSATDGQTYSAKVIIYALGTEHRHLGLPEEDRYKGKGLAYCATCDAMFYKGKTVAVVGGGNSAMTAALYLADLCPRVYLISRGSDLKGEVAWMQEIARRSNIVHIPNNQVKRLIGDDRLVSLELTQANPSGSELSVEGLFVEIGLNPRNSLFVQAGGAIDEYGYVKVAADMSTNLSNFLAAGDVTNGSNGFRQIVTAAAEGAIAADTAYKSLSK